MTRLHGHESKYDYDAFICHADSDADRKFVKYLVDSLEELHPNIRLFIPERDMKDAEDTKTIRFMVEERCRMTLVVLSQDYYGDDVAKFTLSVATSMNIKSKRSKRIIPILRSSCRVPNLIRHLTACDYTKEDLREWFIPRISNALKHCKHSISDTTSCP